MTKTCKPVLRETFSSYRGRPLVVQLFSTTMRIRPKGRRMWYEVSYDQIFTTGARNAARAAAEEKAAKRKAKGKVTR